MAIAKTFSKSDDAYLADAYLESEGVEATVIEDSA